MQRNTLFSIFATAAFGIVMAGPANAADQTWDGSESSDWHTAANWVGNAVPGSGDTATFPSFLTAGADEAVVSTADATVGQLSIASTRTVTVTGKTLTLDGSTQTFNGNLILSDGSAIVKFTGGTITASGSSTAGIKGQHNGAKIQIEGGDTLTSTMLIQGHMAMETNGGSGNGTFVNGATGTVLANGTASAPAILLIASGLTFDDVSGAKWQAQGDADAVLQFDVGASCLDGAFLIDDCAKIELAASVVIKTEGGLTHTAGRLTIGSSASFAYDCNSGCSNCTTTVTTSQCVGDCGCP